MKPMDTMPGGTTPVDLFEDTTDPALRNQILRYVVSQFMTDRERGKLLGLHETTRIREHAKILCPEKLKCGHHVWIGEGAVLDAQGGLEIGDYTQVGLSVMLWSHSSHRQALRSKTGVDRSDIVYRPTKIGNNCFIAGPSVVGAGVTIGDGVVIAPLSFVERDLPAGAVFSNNRFRKQLTSDVGHLARIARRLCDVLAEHKLLSTDEHRSLLREIDSFPSLQTEEQHKK